MGTLTETGIGKKKLAARAATVGLSPAARKVLEECFGEFQIEMVPLEGDGLEHRLNKEKFEALVLPLEANTEGAIEVARNSRSNNRVVIFGIGIDARDAVRYSRFGINAVFEAKWFHEPVDREAVLKVVRATHQLVARELRRYVRVPIVTEVSAQSGALRFTAYTQEISAGGMSMTGAPKLAVGQVVQLSFSLPNGAKVNVSASVCWLRESDAGLGARFEPADERRNAVRDWIEQYLEFS